ncbi:MAG: hypothetical protein QOI36_397 [Pseudonocardiales bacterium]|nr:hypothetical protein [Pseudonocardiales bacterium]
MALVMAPQWCHDGAMDLRPYVDRLRHELAVAAEAGGDEARTLAERLTAPLDSAARLVLLEALSAAADEITRELAPGSVDVRLRGRDPGFVVTRPPSDESFDGADDVGGRGTASAPADVVPPASSEAEDGGTSRINLRLPDSLKLRIEEAAGRQRLSVNAWLVRAAQAALEPDDRDRRPRQRSPRGGQRYTGWVR